MFTLPPQLLNFRQPFNTTRTRLNVTIAVALLAVSAGASANHLWWFTDTQDPQYSTTEGTYIHEGESAVKWNAGKASLLTVRSDLIHFESGRYALYLNNSSSAIVTSQSSVLLKADSTTTSKYSPTALFIDNQSQATIDGQFIKIVADTTDSLTAQGIALQNTGDMSASKAVIGSERTVSLTILSNGNGSSYGVKNIEGDLSLVANTILVNSSGYGLHVGNNTELEERPSDAARIDIRAQSTTINATNYGILAFSNGIVDIDSDLTINAPIAIAARGHSSTTINADGTNTVVINGDISFETPGSAHNSGDIIDADINLNLTGSASSWTGNVFTEVPDNHSEEDSRVTGLKVSLNDGARWNPTVIETSSSNFGDNTTLVKSAEKLDHLTLNQGVVNIREVGQKVEVEEITGTGGTIYVAATSDANGTITTGEFSVDAATGAEPMPLAVRYNSIDADDLTEENVQKMQAINGTGATNTAVTEYVPEGEIRGAWSRQNREGVGSYSDNTKLEAFKGVNAAALVQWRNQINHLTKRLGDVRQQMGDIGAWARIYGGESRWGDANRVEMQSTTVQVGGDAKFGDWIVGGAFSYSDSSYDLENGEGDGDMYSLAVYGTRMFEKGSYVDFVARYGYIQNDIKAGNMDVDFDSNALSLSVEGGHTFKFMERAYVEPQIEVTYGFAQGDDTTASNGVKIAQDDYQNLVTRIGVRTGFDFPEDAGTIYAHASYSYDFLGEAEGTASEGNLRASLDEDLGGSWVTYGIGAQFRVGKNAFAYGELERTTGGDVENPYLFNVGIRWTF